MPVDEEATAPDAGNPNVFKTYKGLYKVPLLGGSTTATGKSYTVVGLTCTNELQFMDNINLSGDYLFNLSHVFDTRRRQYSFVAPAQTSGGTIMFLFLSSHTDGLVEWYRSAPDVSAGNVPAKVYLNGLSMNIAGTWYRDVL